jgi:tetratricopeptide (TPR) repeat protein
VREQMSQSGPASAAYSRAAAEYAEDPRAARALERTQAAGGDKESALARHLRLAERDKARAPVEWTRAARLLDELGRKDEAIARLKAALEAQPGLAEAVELAVEMELAAGRVDQAATLLGRAADATDSDAPDERIVAAAQRERAARLWWRAGKTAEALGALEPLLSDKDDPLPLRWLEQSLRLAVGDPARYAEALKAEATAAELSDRQDLPRAIELWHRRGLVLAGVDGEQAVESQERVLALDGTHPAAFVDPAALFLQSGRATELVTLWRARAAAITGQREVLPSLLRLSAALADDAGDLAGARATLANAARLKPLDPVVAELDMRVARRAGDLAQLCEALERDLSAETRPELRFALLVQLAERLEARNQNDRAAARFREALEIVPGHPVAQAGLERAWRAGKHYAQLADMVFNELKDAADARKKVRLYEQLAFVDGELRGDRESALLGFQSIIEIDSAHHPAMRVLERQYLSEQRWPELVGLYDQMGLTASDSAFAAAVHLDRARLRRRAGGDGASAEVEAAVDNDHRLALFKDERSRVALRHVYSRALKENDLAQIAELAARLSDAVGDDTRTAAVCLTRAADALAALGRGDDAKGRFRAAIERAPGHLPAILGLGDEALSDDDWPSATEAAELAGQHLKDPDSRAQAFLLAGALAEEQLRDLDRALKDLRMVLGIEPRSHEAFDRLRVVLTAREDWVHLAELFRRRLEVETDGLRLTELHLELARIARDRLGDRERARNELRSVLQKDAAHIETLKMLAELHWQDQQWAEAAEALIKRARLEKARQPLKQIFFQLGMIYSDHLPDAKRAIACFQRVVKADPNNIVALEHLAGLYLKEWDWRGALEAQSRLAEIEPDKAKKIAHFHKVAKVYEEGFKDARHALEAFRAALEIDPMNLGSVGELARFFDRQSDVQSMRVHLDRSTARVRAQLEQNPYDPAMYHSLFRMFGWRRAPDRAVLAAGVLEHLGALETSPSDDEAAALAKQKEKDPYPGSALADAALDETLFDARVPAGFRHLFRLLDESLAKAFRTDLRRLGIGKNEKLARGHALREVANRIGADLGLREFDLYVTAQHPTALLVEITEPLSVILGSKLLEGDAKNVTEHELRFYLGRVLKMMQCHMSLPMRLSADDLGVLVGAIVRQFVPEFVPKGFEEKQVAAEAARQSKLIPKKMQGELFPFAMECASPQLDLRQIGPALVDTANRAGLLACGLPGPALTALKRMGDGVQVRALLRFAMSDEMAELRRQAGTAVG